MYPGSLLVVWASDEGPGEPLPEVPGAISTNPVVVGSPLRAGSLGGVPLAMRVWDVIAVRELHGAENAMVVVPVRAPLRIWLPDESGTLEPFLLTH